MKTSATPVTSKPSVTDQALTVLMRVVQPYSDLTRQAQESWVDVEVQLSLNNRQKAGDLAWRLVRQFSKEASPRYLRSAKQQLAQLPQEAPFAEFRAKMENLLALASTAEGQGKHEVAIKHSRAVYAQVRELLKSSMARAFFVAKVKQEKWGKGNRNP